MERIELKLKRIHENAVIPQYAHGPEEDAGLDLCAIEEMILIPGVPAVVRTGLSIELPPGFEAQIRGRSGLGKKHGIRIAQGIGTIDPSYRGEIMGLLVWDGHNPNMPVEDHTYDLVDSITIPGVAKDVEVYAENPVKRFRIAPGDRIMQMVIARYVGVSIVESELTGSARGANGMGSTGVNR
jgi:dUTP pyrophosphatase